MLPQPKNEKEFDLLKKQPDLFFSAVKQLFQETFQRQVKSLDPIIEGSCPVFEVDHQYIFKFFAPIYKDSFDVEKSALQILSNENQVPCPQFINSSTIDNWNIIVMSKIPGVCLKNIWSNLELEQKEKISFDIGNLCRNLHKVKVTSFSPEALQWGDFIKNQIRNCYDNHAQYGLDKTLLDEIPGFLKEIKLQDNQDSLSLLHTEIMPDHIFVENKNGDYKLTGIIDFEPSMLGNIEYDFAAVGIFVSSGNSRLFSAFLNGYGIKQHNTDFKRRIMKYLLLHRYSYFKWYFEFMPKADSLRDLAEIWF